MCSSYLPLKEGDPVSLMGQYLKAQTATDLWYDLEMLLKRYASVGLNNMTADKVLILSKYKYVARNTKMFMPLFARYIVFLSCIFARNTEILREIWTGRSAAGRPVFRYSFVKRTVTEPLPKAAERPSVDWSLPMRV